MAKNIIILSDGTGNSASKPLKSNVWRLYQALDIRDSTDPPAVAYYDNGVGTENWKPLAALGGAFGIGVWKNVRDLYTYLCRNYNAVEKDSIYLFGFSRGAFTVRLLTGLVGKCGIVKAASEDELLANVEMAYIEYRSDFILRASETRNLIPATLGLIREPIYEMPARAGSLEHRHSRIKLPCEQHWPQLTFLGVWDTVDAYGMPVEELKDGLDRWIWPMSFADRQLSNSVSCVRHAVCLDDERPTFTPVLWSEKTSGGEAVDSQRLKQVWFAGVHSNVGGGYPDDGLAYVALDWMMQEAEQKGLTLIESYRQDAQCRADAHGEMYDSRSGIAGYYRYGPRDVRRLSQDERHHVSIERPKVHRSVLERIGRRRVAYSPVSPPQALLGANTLVQDPEDAYVLIAGAPLPAPGDPGPSNAWMDCALDAVWQRRVAYLATVAGSVLLALFPLLFWKSAFPETPRGGVVGKLLGLAPFYLTPWLNAFAAHWVLAAILIVFVAWLFFRVSSRLQAKIERRAERAWTVANGVPAPDPPPLETADKIARRFRTTATVTGLHDLIANTIIPTLFAWTVGLLILPFVLINLVWEQSKRKAWLPPGTTKYISRGT